MSATGEIQVIGRGGLLEPLRGAFARWRRRRAHRTQLIADRRAATARERRAELGERALLERELRTQLRDHEQTVALSRLHRLL